MSHPWTRSWVVGAAALILVPSACVVACGDDDSGSPGKPADAGADSSADAAADSAVDAAADSAVDAAADSAVDAAADSAVDAAADSAVDAAADSAVDAAADSAVDAAADSAVDAAADSAVDAAADSAVDAAADAAPDAQADSGCATYLDGNYTWGIWTCGTTDIRAYAISLGIASVEETFSGTAGVVNVSYSGTPACTRTTAFTVAYPSCGVVTSTTATSYTCSATCAAAKCTSGNQASLIDTFNLTQNGKSFTGTRVLDATFLAQVTLQKLAGCKAGDTETAEFIKQ